MSIQFRRGNESKRLASTEVLEAGQPFFEKDTNKLYIGDGTTQLKSLNKIQANDSNAAHLSTNNIFTGINTFNNVISAKQGLISSNGDNLLDNAKLNYNSISRYTDNHNYILTFPVKTGTLAIIDDIVEFSSHKYLINYNCSLTREATMWIVGNSSTGQYGSYTCPGYLVAGYGSGSSSMNNDVVAIGPGGLYRYLSTGSKIKFTLPDTAGTLALTKDIPDISTYAKLSGGNTFAGVQKFNDKVNIISSDGLYVSGPTQVYTLNITMGKILYPAFDTTTYEYNLPHTSGTLALTSNIKVYYKHNLIISQGTTNSNRVSIYCQIISTNSTKITNLSTLQSMLTTKDFIPAAGTCYAWSDTTKLIVSGITRNGVVSHGMAGKYSDQFDYDAAWTTINNRKTLTWHDDVATL